MKTAVHQYEDKLLEFAYGELPTPEAQAVEAHVRDCAKCSKALSEIRAVRSTMSALPLEAAPDAGLESLLAYAEQAAARTPSEAGASRGWRRFLAPLASAMALVVVGVVAWRANQVFDPDPAMMAVKAEREQKEEAKGTSYEERPAPVAAAPTPQAAAPAEPSPEPWAGDEAAGRKAGTRLTEEKAKALPADDALAAAFGGEGKRDEPKRQVAPSSTSKRSKDAFAEAPAKEQKAEPVALADDYSNAALRGATKAPAMGTFGLGTGSTSSVSGGSAAAGTGGLLGSASGAALDTGADKNQAEGRAEASTRAAPPPPEPAAAPSAPAPSPKQSYSLPGLSKKKSPAPSSAAVEAEADELAVARSDSLSADRDAKVAERERAQSRASLLEAARVAGSRGDRQEELRLVLAVLQAGATGYEKVEALKRACDAWESLGDFERADPYCDQLLAEFPQTAAANAVAKRRSNVQRAAPAKPVSKPAAAEPAQRY